MIILWRQEAYEEFGGVPRKFSREFAVASALFLTDTMLDHCSISHKGVYFLHLATPFARVNPVVQAVLSSGSGLSRPLQNLSQHPQRRPLMDLCATR